jgi:hypothetical protein
MIQKKIAAVLRKKSQLKGLKKAKNLELNTSQTSTLHLRNLDLKINEITAIADILKQDHTGFIKSISFSNNPLIGDEGATLIAKSLPTSILEIGLVGCGISDKGGSELLKWMKKSPQLRMICMEKNNFSNELKIEIKNFKTNNPKIMVVF